MTRAEAEALGWTFDIGLQAGTASIDGRRILVISDDAEPDLLDRIQALYDSGADPAEEGAAAQNDATLRQRIRDIGDELRSTRDEYLELVDLVASPDGTNADARTLAVQTGRRLDRATRAVDALARITFNQLDEAP